MVKGTQIKRKTTNAKRATSNTLKRYCLVILGKKKCLRFAFNGIRPRENGGVDFGYSKIHRMP
jgi:hypothetical protein